MEPRKSFRTDTIEGLTALVDMREIEIKSLEAKIDRIIAWIEDVKANQDIMSVSQMEGLLESIKPFKKLLRR